MIFATIAHGQTKICHLPVKMPKSRSRTKPSLLVSNRGKRVLREGAHRAQGVRDGDRPTRFFRRPRTRFIRAVKAFCLVSSIVLAAVTFWMAYATYVDGHCMAIMQDWGNRMTFISWCSQVLLIPAGFSCSDL